MDERLRQIGTTPLDPTLLAAGAASFLRRTVGDGVVEAIPVHDDAALAQAFGAHQAVLAV